MMNSWDLICGVTTGRDSLLYYYFLLLLLRLADYAFKVGDTVLKVPGCLGRDSLMATGWEQNNCYEAESLK